MRLLKLIKFKILLISDMMGNRNGAIIFTSSVAGLVGVYGLAPYCASKFAVRGYAEALAMGKKKLSASVATTSASSFLNFFLFYAFS